MRWSRERMVRKRSAVSHPRAVECELAQAVALSEAAPKSMDATRTEVLAASVLTAFVLLVGLFPFPFLRVINGGVAEVLGRFG